MPQEEHGFDVDELDLRLIEALVQDPEADFKKLAQNLTVDQRTVARRVHMMKEAGIMRRVTEIGWSKLGLHARAYVGSTTALGEKSVSKLREFIRADPRIVEAYETLGSHQYHMHILEADLPRLRETVLRDLEPLTADLSTTLVTSEIKPRNYLPLVQFLRVTRFPRSEAPISNSGIPPGSS